MSDLSCTCVFFCDTRCKFHFPLGEPAKEAVTAPTQSSEDLEIFVENARETVAEKGRFDWVDAKNLLRYIDALKSEKGPVTAAQPVNADTKRALMDYLSANDGEDSVEMLAEDILRIVAAQPDLWAEYLEHVCSCNLPHFTCFFHTKFGEALKGKEASGYTGELAKWVAAGQVAYWEGIGDAPLFPRSQPDLRALTAKLRDVLQRLLDHDSAIRTKGSSAPRSCPCCEKSEDGNGNISHYLSCHFERARDALVSAIGAAPKESET